MTDKTKRKRNNFLSFRVSEKTLKNLNLMAKQTGKTRGIMGKDAMKNWLKLELFNQTNEMITISKRMFTKLLSLLKQEELNAIAEDNSTLFANILKFLVEVPMNEDTLKKLGEGSEIQKPSEQKSKKKKPK